jgi:membrane protein implicated in regulation of membrane protease activity
MGGLNQILAGEPFWLWLVVGAAILAAEVATGTGWLLWAAASAGVVGLMALALPTSFPIELGVFAVLTLATSLLARRFLPKAFVQQGPDINDNLARVVGERGFAATDFKAGQGRVAIDGKEWAAELDGAESLAVGSAVKVVSVRGLTLKVKPLG